jgi:GT2 family glycosyltransferase
MAAIIHYNRWPDVLDTIRQLPTQGIPYGRVIVIDNGSPDEAAPAAVQECPGVRWFRQDRNGGFASAANEALRLASAEEGIERLLILTHEVRLGGRSLERMHEAMRTGALAAVGPLVARRSAPDVIWSAGGRLSRFLAVPGGLLQGQPVSAAGDADRGPIVWLEGCCMLLDVSTARDIGGFHEPYFLYFEEVDFFLRLTRAGKRFALCRDAIAYQEPGTLDVYLATRNRLLLARRNLGWVSVVSVVADVLLRLLTAPLMKKRGRRRRTQQRFFGLVDGLTPIGRVPLRLHQVGG